MLIWAHKLPLVIRIFLSKIPERWSEVLQLDHWNTSNTAPSARHSHADTRPPSKRMTRSSFPLKSQWPYALDTPTCLGVNLKMRSIFFHVQSTVVGSLTRIATLVFVSDGWIRTSRLYEPASAWQLIFFLSFPWNIYADYWSMEQMLQKALNQN